VSARIVDRFDHARFAMASAVVMGLALAGAVAAPSLPVSIALFIVAGFASGPIYPLIIAVAGDRFPHRSAAVGGFLSGTAIVGSVVYPPVMGFMSVTVGLAAAMLGAAMLALATGVMLVVASRSRSMEAVAPPA
jgi:MFS family permease